MADAECVAFLQEALPRLGLRWQGFRKVHGQVCKRLRRRMNELGIEGFAAYRKRLDTHPEEWTVLDGLTHITISRFFRDKSIFEALERRVLPDIAARAEAEKRQARFWSAGCASGEEPYTLKILWDLAVAPAFPGVECSVDRNRCRRNRAETRAQGLLFQRQPARATGSPAPSRLRAERQPLLRAAATPRRRELPASGPAFRRARRFLRSHSLPQCRFHLFRTSPASRSPGSHPRTARSSPAISSSARRRSYPVR